MKQYKCSVCGYIYDESKGIPEAGIAPGTKWEDLPEDFVCPLCKASKSAFKVVEEEKDEVLDLEKPHVEKELSPMELSVICSNLARGCEKQYMEKQAEAFKDLAEFFSKKRQEVDEVSMNKLLELVENDLNEAYPYANKISKDNADRGAMRSLVWSEKVSNMLNSILKRYENEGENMLKNTNVYVCTICGFVYIGDKAPELCPVCKVPDWKFEKIEGRTK